MSDGPLQGSSDVPSDAFVGQVKDALEHLYDLRYLQQHALTNGLASEEPDSPELPGKRLRRELLQAIETLSPGEDVPFRAAHARVHNLLTLHYLEKVTIQEAAYQLGISVRQAQRNLREGERSVATILWVRRSVQSEQSPSTVDLSSFRAEMARLKSRARQTDIGELVERAWGAVAPLAQKRGIRLDLHLPTKPIVLQIDPMLAEQLFVDLLSVAVVKASEADETVLTVGFASRSAESDETGIGPTVKRLADQLGWSVRGERGGEGDIILRTHMIPRCPTILIIDDNEGLVELLMRYLSQRACRVIAAEDGHNGLRLAQEAAPEAIVLDMMMPGMSGWEVLQRLQNDPQTAHIPVVVCSVVANPELVQALGASVFLPKPVRQQDVLDALRRLDVV